MGPEAGGHRARTFCGVNGPVALFVAYAAAGEVWSLRSAVARVRIVTAHPRLAAVLTLLG